MPKISIILTVFNWEKYIYDTINSVLNQTFTNFELIIINDCSTDKSDNIIKSINDKRIINIKNSENLNIVKSRNLWIIKSTWDYICFLDQDDLLVSTKLEKQNYFLDNNIDYGLVWCNIINIDENNYTIWNTYVPESDKIIRNRILRSSQFACWAVMFRRLLINKIWLLNEKYIKSDDYDLWLRIWTISKMYNLKEQLFKYRYHSNNTSNNSHKEMSIKSLKLSIKYRSFYPNFYKSIILWLWFIIIPNNISSKILKYTNKLKYKWLTKT